MMNRTIITCLFSLLLIVSPLVECQRSKPHDGSWWVSWGDEQKVLYIVGYLDGIQTGKNIAASQGIKGRVDAPAGCTAAKMMDFSDIQIGQLETGLDTFYKDFRNTLIPVGQALLYVRDQVSGCSDTVLAQEISTLRQAWASAN